MAEDYEHDTRYLLRREYASKPFYRDACHIVFDTESIDGYYLTMLNPKVADTGFVSHVAKAMSLPQTPHESVDDGNTNYRIIKDPVTHGVITHFGLAVESINGVVAIPVEG